MSKKSKIYQLKAADPLKQTFLTNGSGFVHQKPFSEYQKFNFPYKIQICSLSFLHRSYIFCLLLQNVIENENFWFP